ncbi:MAG TPA: LysE family transporter [Kiloniellaceae bacterium]|nr:LysE family transporter [Kiloniellaceae bacterium]
MILGVDLLVTFFKGLAIGFAMAVPVGPVGLMCIRRTLNYGLMIGLLSGLGAALADAFFALVAAAGLAALTDFLLAAETELRCAGGIFLIVLGIWTFFKRPPTEGSTRRAHGAIATTFLLTLTNPMTLLAFLGFFVTFGVSVTDGLLIGIVMLVGGVFLGSGLWWSLLCIGIGEIRHRIDDNLLLWINRGSAVAIASFGIYVLAISLF